MSSITLPTIHLNGTSRTALKESYWEAATALFQAIKVVEAVELNGRDYYPQGPNAFPKAREEHEKRLKKLAEVRAELVEIVDHCGDI